MVNYNFIKEYENKILNGFFWNNELLKRRYGLNYYFFKKKYDEYNKNVQDGGSKNSNYIEIKYKGEKVKFYKKYSEDVNNKRNVVELYFSSLDEKRNCVMIVIYKNKAQIQGIDVDPTSGCFFDATLNNSTNLLEVTIKMLEKNKDELEIDKIELVDNSYIYCKPENISLTKLSFLQHGITFYEKFGFLPKGEKKQIKYKKSQEKIKNIVVKDIDLNIFIKDYKKDNKITKRIQKIIESYNNIENKNLELIIWFNFISKKYLKKECNFFDEFMNHIIDDLKLKIYEKEKWIKNIII